jgi:Icc protein
MNPEQSFHALCNRLEQHPEADAIVHTGDFAQAPTPVTYQRYINFMQSLGIPFSDPGNHDDVALSFS